MPTVSIDKLENLSLEERDGAIRSLTRKARVNYTPDENNFRDYNILLDVLNNPDVPQPFDRLTESGLEQLVLVGRTPSIVENDPGTVDVILKYEHILDGPNQQLISPTPVGTAATGIIFGKGRCSIVEKTTNFYYPGGDPNNGKVQILVGNTFPDWDSYAVGLSVYQVTDPITGNTLEYPRTAIQGGEVSIPFPQSNFTIMGIIGTTNPQALGRSIIAKINELTWMGEDPFKWICSDVQWDVLNAYQLQQDTNFTPIYKFAFEFQFNYDTWNPTVAFNDQRTGRPPAGLEEATHTTDYPLPPDEGPAPPVSISVKNMTHNIYNGEPQPAGFWQVPALAPLDFEKFFLSNFES